MDRSPPVVGRLAALLLALSVALPCAVRADDPPQVIRVFTLKYKKADEVALLVRPLLTDSGSLVLQPKLNTLTVRDTSSAVERTAEAIASYDLPPRGVEIAVTLLKSSSEQKKTGEKRAVSDVIAGVGEQLKKRFNFTDYERLDSVVVQGTEGDKVGYVIGGEYRLEFLIESSTDDKVIRLKSLTLERLRRDAKGAETRREILRTSINVQVGHTYIYGVGKDEAASQALFLVFYPNWRGPGPGIAGVR